MKPYLVCTKLYEIRQGGSRRLMNEIKAGSRFQSVTLSKRESENQHTEEVQVKIARDLRDGWKQNGPNVHARYSIVSEYSDGTEVPHV